MFAIIVIHRGVRLNNGIALYKKAPKTSGPHVTLLCTASTIHFQPNSAHLMSVSMAVDNFQSFGGGGGGGGGAIMTGGWVRGSAVRSTNGVSPHLLLSKTYHCMINCRT